MKNTMPQTSGLSNFKSICTIIVVIGCFAVLWPKIFYPMLLYGLNWDSRGSHASDINEQTLPPKVREAMRSSPVKNPSKNVQKLPGRPQFYTGKREINTASSQNSVWNVVVPLYALIVIIIFLYALFKLSLKSGKTKPNIHSIPPLHNPDECKECQYDLLRKEYTNKRYDPFLSRSTYRTFDYYGRRNVCQVMRSLVEDVKTFRDQLIKAQICQCKLEKYKKECNEAEEFLAQMEQQENDCPKMQDQDQNEDLIEDENSNSDNNNKESLSVNEEILNNHDETENSTDQNIIIDEEKTDKEQIKNVSNTNIPLEISMIKKRKKHRKFKILKDITNPKITYKKIDFSSFDWKLVKKISQKLNHFKKND